MIFLIVCLLYPSPVFSRAGTWNVFRPEQFGAKGDGVQDDTKYIQKCIGSAQNGISPHALKVVPGRPRFSATTFLALRSACGVPHAV